MLTPEKEPSLREVPVIEFLPGGKQVRILDVLLDVLPLPPKTLAQRFIPKWEQFEEKTCFDAPTVRLLRDLALRMKGGLSSRLEGSTGVSKTYCIELICALTNRNYYRHNFSRDTDVGDIVGRFIPSDSGASVRFEQILANPEINKKSREIIEKAKAETRPLSISESQEIARLEGFKGFDDTKQWKWKNGPLTGAMMYGTVFVADEFNEAPPAVAERLNSVTEKNPTLRLVEHEGEIIRPLTKAEQKIVDNGGAIPGVIGLHKDFIFFSTQNPYGIGGGRIQESSAARNRLMDREVGPLTEKEYRQFLNFLIKGEQPDIEWQGKKYKGKKGIKTTYIDLANIPNIDILIGWLAKFQMDLLKLTQEGKIGSERDLKGGSYEYTRRNFLRFLDVIKAARTTLVDTDALYNKQETKYNDNWHDLIMEAIYQEFLSGIYEEDQEVIKELISASGIEEYLGPSKNNPKPPSWVEQARKKGLEVSQNRDGVWTLSQLSFNKRLLKAFQLDEQNKYPNIKTPEDLKKFIEEQGFKITFTEGQTVEITPPPLKSLIELFVERKKQKEIPILKKVVEKE